MFLQTSYGWQMLSTYIQLAFLSPKIGPDVLFPCPILILLCIPGTIVVPTKLGKLGPGHRKVREC